MSLGWRLPVDGMVGKARRNVEESNAKGKGDTGSRESPRREYGIEGNEHGHSSGVGAEERSRSSGNMAPEGEQRGGD